MPLKLNSPRVAETAVTTQLWNANTTGFEISEDAPEQITLRAYFESEPDAEKVRSQILHALQLCEIPAHTLHSVTPLTIAEQDWLAEWKKGYEPIEIGQKIFIVPSWKRNEIAATDRIIIQIDQAWHLEQVPTKQRVDV